MSYLYREKTERENERDLTVKNKNKAGTICCFISSLIPILVRAEQQVRMLVLFSHLSKICISTLAFVLVAGHSCQPFSHRGRAGADILTTPVICLRGVLTPVRSGVGGQIQTACLPPKFSSLTCVKVANPSHRQVLHSKRQRRTFVSNQCSSTPDPGEPTGLESFLFQTRTNALGSTGRPALG